MARPTTLTWSEVACVVLLCITNVLANETRPGSLVEPPVMGCNQELQRYLVTQTNLTLAAIDNVKENYTWRKFNMAWGDTNTILRASQDHEFVGVCDEEVCVRVLPRIPSSPFSRPMTSLRAGELMVELLEYTQQCAYALEVIFLDQVLHEDHFQGAVDTIYRQLKSLVGAFLWGANQCQVTPRHETLNNLLGKVYKGAGTTLRAERGFRVLRHCYSGLQHISQVFSLTEVYPLFR